MSKSSMLAKQKHSGSIYPRTKKSNLCFSGEPLLQGRHRIHPYPAMLHPLLVNFLIDKYTRKGDIIFDPFCGSGVTCLQSGINGHKSIGFDINPMALLIAKAKTQSYDNNLLYKEFEHLMSFIRKSDRADIPNIKNVDYWYSEGVIADLGRIRYALKNDLYQYKTFFVASFAFICRDQSLTRNGEFKRYRIEKQKIEKAKNEVIPRFFSRTKEMIEVFAESDTPKSKSRILLANSEDMIQEDMPYDMVITSPPYGDSRTTVAYGQYTSFGSEWTKDINPYYERGNIYDVDKEGLGKANPLNEELKQYRILTDVLDEIDAVDCKRGNDVRNFFNGYYNAIRNVARKLGAKGRACFVVGNRTVKHRQIPMDQITASFLESMGMSFRGIFTRGIYNKVMPSKNSPSNVVGAKSQTMTEEHVVVFDKE